MARHAEGLGEDEGAVFRSACEIALIGTNGSPKVTSRSERNVLLSPALAHSRKPEGLQDALERMFPNANKLELFARRVRAGWTCLGNECPGTVGEGIRDSLRAYAGAV
jgi:N6-adenosine-specific RNA methylase IME4